MADIKNYGLKGVGNDVQFGKGGARITWSNQYQEFGFQHANSAYANLNFNLGYFTTLSDDTITIEAGNITGAVNGAFSGTVQFGGLSDGNLTIAGYTSNLSASAASNELVTADAIKTYVDAQVSGSSNLNLAGGAGVGVVNLATGQSLDVSGTANEIETSVSGNVITVGIVSDPTLTGNVTTTGNLSVSGSLISDDITSSAISINGDATISGNLTVNGTQTIVNSTVVSIDDAVIMVNSDGGVVNAGLVANIAGVSKELVWNVSSNVWSVGSETFQAGTFLGNLTGTAANATVLQTARFFSASGDATASAVSFNGSANVDLALTLANTAVTAGTYGDATNIPQFTVDSKGRVTAVSNISISTNFGIAGDTGTDTVAGGETLTVAGTANEIETSVTNNTITVGIVSNPTLTGTVTAGNLSTTGSTSTGTLNATGNITGANLISNALVSAVTMTATGNITGGNISTTGTLSTTGNLSANNVIATNDVSGATGTFSGTVSANNLNITNTISVGGGVGGSITGANSITANYFVANQTITATGNITGGNIVTTGAVSFGTLSDGNISIAGYTSNLAASAASNELPTADTVKAYVDSKVGAATANIAGGTGTGSVDLDSQTLTVAGTTNQIATSASGQTITVALTDAVTISGTMTAGNLSTAGATSTGTLTATGNITGANLISNALVSAATVTATGDITGGNLFTLGTANVGTLVATGAATVSGNLTVSGTLLSDDITASQVTVAGDATITGNLTVNGTTTTINSTVVSVDDAIIMVNSDGSVVNSGLVANVAGVNKELVWNTASNVWTVNSETFTAGNLSTTGIVTFGSLNDGAITVDSFTGNIFASALANQVATADTVKAYVDAQVSGSSTLNLSGDAGSGNINLANAQILTVNGTADEIETSVSGNVITIGLPSNVAVSDNLTVGSNIFRVNASNVVNSSTTYGMEVSNIYSAYSGEVSYRFGVEPTTGFNQGYGGWVAQQSQDGWATADYAYVKVGGLDVDENGWLTAPNGTFTSNVSIGNLTVDYDIALGGTTANAIVTGASTIALNDNDWSLPTTNAVVGYGQIVGSYSGMLRTAVTTNGNSEYALFTPPTLTGRTIYVSKIVIKVTTAFTAATVGVGGYGGSTTNNHLFINDEWDLNTVGTYVIECDGDKTTNGNSALYLTLNNNESTGVATVTVHYSSVPN